MGREPTQGVRSRKRWRSDDGGLRTAALSWPRLADQIRLPSCDPTNPAGGSTPATRTPWRRSPWPKHSPPSTSSRPRARRSAPSSARSRRCPRPASAPPPSRGRSPARSSRRTRSTRSSWATCSRPASARRPRGRRRSTPGIPNTVPGTTVEQGLRLGPAGGHLRREDHRARRRRPRRRRRHGVDVERAVLPRRRRAPGTAWATASSSTG